MPNLGTQDEAVRRATHDKLAKTQEMYNFFVNKAGLQGENLANLFDDPLLRKSVDAVRRLDIGEDERTKLLEGLAESYRSTLQAGNVDRIEQIFKQWVSEMNPDYEKKNQFIPPDESRERVSDFANKMAEMFIQLATLHRESDDFDAASRMQALADKWLKEALAHPRSIVSKQRSPQGEAPSFAPVRPQERTSGNN